MSLFNLVSEFKLDYPRTQHQGRRRQESTVAIYGPQCQQTDSQSHSLNVLSITGGQYSANLTLIDCSISERL